jgi:hypothetical protein
MLTKYRLLNRLQTYIFLKFFQMSSVLAYSATVVHKVPRPVRYFGLSKCWAIPGKKCFKYGTFYDSPLLLTLVLSTSVRRQEAVENTVVFSFAYLVSELHGRLEIYGEMLYDYVSIYHKHPCFVILKSLVQILVQLSHFFPVTLTKCSDNTSC